MSGVAKDDINPNSPADSTIPAQSEANAGKPDSPDAGVSAAQLPPLFGPAPSTPTAKDPALKDEAEHRSRRPAPHLRVVSDADAELAAPAVHQRIGDEIRAARENTGFTLEQVSRETRVHISHLRAIEEMTPGLLGAPVYAKGYIKSYARFLGMDEQTTLDRYLSECAAILKDPEKVEIVQPASSKARKLPVAVPVLGILVVALVGAGAVLMLNSGDKSPAVITDPSSNQGAGVAAEPVAPQLRIVALKRSMLEVRSAKGDKYVHRFYNPGEFFVVRVGAGFTVSADDGAAFEWRLGDQSLGLLQPEGGPVYSQNVDLAAQRQPIVVAPPVDPNAVVAPHDPALDAYPATPGALVTGANPAPAKPKPPKPVQTTPSTNTAPKPAAPAEPAPPVHDPALDAYPDQVATPPPGQ
ncbi:MAG: helix-turn-helix domain-containing protein [Hyphomonadaceae bacterium]